ncbi:MAG: hypothetical protein ACK4ND_01515 [Cytophagaceae bacterium]
MKSEKILLIIFFSLISFGFMFLGIYLSGLLDSPEHFQVSALVIGSFFFILGLLGLIPLFRLDEVIEMETKTPEPKKSDKAVEVGLIIFGIAILGLLNYLAFHSYNNTVPLYKEELSVVHGHLSEEVEYLSPAKGSHSLYIRLKEYPGFRFSVPHAREYSFIRKHLNPGDPVQLSILNEEYGLWIGKTKEPGFWDKHEGYGTIQTYHIQDVQYIYLNLDDHNELSLEDAALGIPIILTLDLIIIIVVGIVLIRRNKKKNIKKDLSKFSH